MINPIDKYVQLSRKKKDIERRMGEIKKELITLYEERPIEEEERNKLQGVDHCLTVVISTSERFDKKKYEARYGRFHAAYYKTSTSTQLRVS